MDFASFIAATTLIGASSNVLPVHDFDYSFYDENSIIRIESGAHFFRPKFPEISFLGLTHVGNNGLIWNLTTPFISEKYTQGISINATLYHDYVIDRASIIKFSASFSSLPKENISPCTDSIGRKFHCYYGTQPNGAYFSLPFEAVEGLFYRQNRSFNLNELGVTWIMTF